MEHAFFQGCLTLLPKCKLANNEADAFLAETSELIERYGCKSIVINMSEIEYITSPGLHALLLLKRKVSDITLNNIQPAVREVLDSSGLTRLFHTTDGFRKVNIEGCKIIGKGIKGTVYQYSPDTVIKVFNNTEQLQNILKERELACCALIHGLPTAISFDVVRVGTQYGAMFELIDAESMSQDLKSNPEHLEDYAGIFARLLLNVHHTALHSDYNVPDIKPLVFKWLEKSSLVLDNNDARRIHELICSVPDTHTLIHGDYHTNNIMMQRGEPFMIDMGTLSYGHPVFELANIYTTYVGFGKYDKSMVENFLGLSYDFCLNFWEIFFSRYTENLSKTEKNRLFTWARLLGSIRYLHHLLRRDNNSETDKHIISDLSDTVSILLPNVIPY